MIMANKLDHPALSLVLLIAMLVVQVHGETITKKCVTDGESTVCLAGHKAERVMVKSDGSEVIRTTMTEKEALTFFRAKDEKDLLKACVTLEAIGKMTPTIHDSCDNAADWLSDHGYTCYKDGHCELTEITPTKDRQQPHARRN